MIEAVLFDWGHTLMDWTWDDELLAAGHRLGLEAIGRNGSETAARMTTRFREHYFPQIESSWSAPEEIEYPGFVRALLGDVGIDVDDDELDRFLDAEHSAWEPASRLGATTHALLESLRELGLKLGLVSNAWDHPRVLHGDLERMGIAERIDFAVFSSEGGLRKPHPSIFRRALEALDVAPEHALFVGDRVYADIRGAADVGMTTVQALWFRADEHPEGAEPDFHAFTQMDVLNIVRRLNAVS